MGAITALCQRLSAGKLIGTSKNGIKVYRKTTDDGVITTSFKNGKKFKRIFQYTDIERDVFENKVLGKNSRTHVTNHETGDVTWVGVMYRKLTKPKQGKNWAMRDYEPGIFKRWGLRVENSNRTERAHERISFNNQDYARLTETHEEYLKNVQKFDFKEIIEHKDGVAREETMYSGRYIKKNRNGYLRHPRFQFDEKPIRLTTHTDGSMSISTPSIIKKTEDEKYDFVNFDK